MIKFTFVNNMNSPDRNKNCMVQVWESNFNISVISEDTFDDDEEIKTLIDEGEAVECVVIMTERYQELLEDAKAYRRQHGYPEIDE